MSLRSGLGLAEIADFSPKQLESLTRSIEQKKQRLEDDINDYIRRKQDELRNYERELLEQYRSMERPPSTQNDRSTVTEGSPPSDVTSPSDPESEPARETETATALENRGPEETAKRTKQNRVHKREKELCGLVTPLYLPLLEARDPPPASKRKEKRRNKEDKGENVEDTFPRSDQEPPSNDAANQGDSRAKTKGGAVKGKQVDREGASRDSSKENAQADTGKKSKRATIKKSSLRHNSSPRSRRKRVSIVIDDQIVLPADNIVESAVTSPSEADASITSVSNASGDDALDPGLDSALEFSAHQGPAHHSLPYPIQLPSPSPTERAGPTFSDPGPPTVYEPPPSAVRTFLDPSPPNAAASIPQHSSTTPIYADRIEQVEDVEEQNLVGGDLDAENFDTYVGGMSGSGVDNVNQANSYGYPSSLGASYLESYMMSRPLSVRMAAAEKAGLAENEKRTLIQGHDTDAKELDVDSIPGNVEDRDDDMDIIGSMDGF